MKGWMKGWMEGWVEGWMEGWVQECMEWVLGGVNSDRLLGAGPAFPSGGGAHPRAQGVRPSPPPTPRRPSRPGPCAAWGRAGPRARAGVWGAGPQARGEPPPGGGFGWRGGRHRDRGSPGLRQDGVTADPASRARFSAAPAARWRGAAGRGGRPARGGGAGPAGSPASGRRRRPPPPWATARERRAGRAPTLPVRGPTGTAAASASGSRAGAGVPRGARPLPLARAAGAGALPPRGRRPRAPEEGRPPAPLGPPPAPLRGGRRRLSGLSGEAAETAPTGLSSRNHV